MNVNTSQWRFAHSRHQHEDVLGSPTTCVVLAKNQHAVSVLIRGYNNHNVKVWSRASFDAHWKMGDPVGLDRHEILDINLED